MTFPNEATYNHSLSDDNIANRPLEVVGGRLATLRSLDKISLDEWITVS